MRILVVDDDVSILELLDELLRTEGHEIQTALDGKEALAILQKFSFDLIISDINMPRLSGIQFGYQLREVDISTPILFFSAVSNGAITYANEVQKIGNANFIEDKNFDLLLDTIRETRQNEGI
jgi:DNA-binding response OmpR family regulator